MKTYARALVVAFALAGHAPLANAQERILTPEKAAGFDAVISQCVSFVRLEFANGMCDRLAKSVARLAKENGLGHSHLGRTEWGFGTDVYLKPEGESGFSNPVWLTFYIRATGEPNSAFLWASLYEPVTDGARTGRLVLWEDSGIGAGPRKEISGALSAGFAKKLEPVFKALGEAKAN
jgi:hypothetical protein